MQLCLRPPLLDKDRLFERSRGRHGEQERGPRGTDPHPQKNPFLSTTLRPLIWERTACKELRVLCGYLGAWGTDKRLKSKRAGGRRPKESPSDQEDWC